MLDRLKKLIGVKSFKLFLVVIFFLLPFNSHAGYGTGELKLSDNVIKSLQMYLKAKKGSPMRFLVTENGKNAYWWYCPHLQCKPSGDTKEAKMCTERYGVPCHTFAVRRSIKWKNGIDAKALKIKLTSEDSIQQLKEKLTQLGFYGDGIINSSSSKSDDKKSSNNITKRLESLNNMYEKGLLTEEEFKKAKQKILK